MPEKDTVRKTTNNDPRVCPKCGQIHDIRQDLGVNATRAEVDELITINNRINVAAQASQPVDFPSNVTQDQVQMFVSAALNARAEAMTLRRVWWRDMLAKYELPSEGTFVDLDTCGFYVLLPVT
ncbi:MAG: hypothetical protein LBQ83_05680 [Candidatus Margulisbacteria bacterium]|jgi:hypothetical protein|nr:hypothetical protein [Candidatus Margulisiibacteriota bacterium]